MHYAALMDSATAALAGAIGARVKQERQSRGWTLDTLAVAADVSRRTVVNVERGSANPSVAILLRLSEALGVGLPDLVEPPQPSPVAVTRRGTGPVLWTGDCGGAAVMVAGTVRPDVLEMWDWTLGPGDRHTSEAHAPGTRELLHVHVGTLTLGVGAQAFTLGPGDAAAFPGDVAHSYSNPAAPDSRPSGQPTRFSLAVSEPTKALRETTSVDLPRVEPTSPEVGHG